MTVAARRHFAQVAGAYTAFRTRWPLGALRDQEQRAVRALVDIAPGQRALDVGCGDGATAAWLETRGARVVGVDAVWEMAALARRRGVPTVVQDMEGLGFQACFDWVLCIGALEFTASPGAAVAALARCLRPGGRLVLLFPGRSLLSRAYATYHRAHGLAVHLFRRDEMLAHLRDAGMLLDADWRECLLSSACRARRREDSA
jgi:SAM-dependent methyltransferase